MNHVYATAVFSHNRCMLARCRRSAGSRAGCQAGAAGSHPPPLQAMRPAPAHGSPASRSGRPEGGRASRRGDRAAAPSSARPPARLHTHKASVKLEVIKPRQRHTAGGRGAPAPHSTRKSCVRGSYLPSASTRAFTFVIVSMFAQEEKGDGGGSWLRTS